MPVCYGDTHQTFKHTDIHWVLIIKAHNIFEHLPWAGQRFWLVCSIGSPVPHSSIGLPVPHSNRIRQGSLFIPFLRWDSRGLERVGTLARYHSWHGMEPGVGLTSEASLNQQTELPLWVPGGGQGQNQDTSPPAWGHCWWSQGCPGKPAAPLCPLFICQEKGELSWCGRCAREEAAIRQLTDTASASLYHAPLASRMSHADHTCTTFSILTIPSPLHAAPPPRRVHICSDMEKNETLK